MGRHLAARTVHCGGCTPQALAGPRRAMSGRVGVRGSDIAHRPASALSRFVTNPALGAFPDRYGRPAFAGGILVATVRREDPISMETEEPEIESALVDLDDLPMTYVMTLDRHDDVLASAIQRIVDDAGRELRSTVSRFSNYLTSND